MPKTGAKYAEKYDDAKYAKLVEFALLAELGDGTDGDDGIRTLMSYIDLEVFQRVDLIANILKQYPHMAEHIPFEYVATTEELVGLVHELRFDQTRLLAYMICRVPSLSVNKDFMMKLLREGSFKDEKRTALSLFGPFRNDPEVVEAAVKCGSSLTFASCEKLKHELHLVLAAVERNGREFSCVPTEFKNHEDVVYAALKNNVKDAYTYLDASGKDNPKLIVELVRNDHFGEYFDDVPEWAKKDEKLLELRKLALSLHTDGITHTLAMESLTKLKCEQEQEKREGDATNEGGVKRGLVAEEGDAKHARK